MAQPTATGALFEIYFIALGFHQRSTLSILVFGDESPMKMASSLKGKNVNRKTR
jgi:hypothetical protein